MMTPFLKDGYIYGVCSYGQLRCLNINSGERVWESLAATGGKEVRWGNAFIVAHEDRYFLFNEHGELIIAKLSPEGYQEISRTKIIEPTNKLAQARRGLDAPGLCQQMRVRPERQGNHLPVAGREINRRHFSAIRRTILPPRAALCTVPGGVANLV